MTACACPLTRSRKTRQAHGRLGLGSQAYFSTFADLFGESLTEPGSFRLNVILVGPNINLNLQHLDNYNVGFHRLVTERSQTDSLAPAHPLSPIFFDLRPFINQALNLVLTSPPRA